MIAFFKTLIYIPLYNIFILLLNINWIDAGLATVTLVVLVKIVLFPLSKKSSVTQIKMKDKEGELAAIKEKYKDKQEQAVKTMEFYKTNKINPFSSIFTIILQIPVVFSLYYIFYRSGLPNIDTNLLYPFVKAPTSVSMVFLGILDVSQKSLVLAALAAISSFLQMHLISPTTKSNTKSIQNSNREDLSKMMAKQMKFTMPIIVFLISWRISAIVALYWFVNNLVSIAQDAYVRKQLKTNLRP